VDLHRAPILHRARDRGQAEATPIVPFLMHSGRGLIVYQPVYRDGAPTATVAQRRAALLGFASGAFRATDLAAAATSAIPANVTIQLQQGGHPAVGASDVLYDTASAPIHVADRTWILVLHDPSGPSLGLPILMAVVGISLACLLGALVLVWSRNERMEELQRQAGQDSLTGLKNRRRFEEDLRGDEFAIVLPHCDAAEARVVAEAIATAIREHVPAQDGGPAVTASIGIAMFGADPRTSFESVLSEADTAMYAAKDAGRDGVRVFDPVAVRGDA
jgi:hypothetical protein